MTKLTQQLIEQYYDGELSPPKAKQVEAALADHPEMRRSLEQMEKLRKRRDILMTQCIEWFTI